MTRLLVGLIVGLIVAAVLPPTPGVAQSACTFALGFRALRDQIPDVVGQCLEDEHFNAENGNVEQRTTRGLLVWRKADNWTAFTDGATTWLNGPSGLQSRPNGGPPFSWEVGTAAASPQPRFNPASLTGSGPLCSDEPPVTLARSWQVSAPRGLPGPVRPGEVVRIGLRNKFGEPTETHWVQARVIAPDGSATTATALLRSSDWAELSYPRQFPDATPVQAGVYTVVWETSGGFVACDGFVVQNY